MQQSTPPRTASKQCAPRQGRRVSALADAYGRTIKHALRGADEEQFAECFPNIQPELLEILWQGYRQVLHGSRVHIESDFDAICEETALTDKLHQLEELCEAQGVSDDPHARQAAGSLSGEDRPTRAVRAALHAARRAEAEQLESILARAAARREALEAQLAARVAELELRANALRPLAALDTNVSRACLAWESHKLQAAAEA
ncbi:hypothetical protein F751_4560 [Auxenochlorella protothecoides]|uniref:Uncharacterized protein n=1 Tax=Auxenochlorella protothecoides TaxID=3075 RepID=A0A087SNI6_AUXPR|nr:hypothetical protein F751_4560 [Auxenochlorella protothecoides]KFM27290.1 hypothetical protein F751_4560 [Auxenochlorella protothecoides]RMZ57094.1 hypothetical protein APUTEX25_002326 [Auxenochlorella protothecoides]|eukprot:RMZ57094.1 hypothetical protein APUTEX25_002326 [Auxenochlorella protothecoides]